MVKKKEDKNEPSPWKDSQAKKLLRQDILDGKVVDSMTPMQIFQMRPEYAPYGLKKFRSNWYSLRDSIKDNQAKASSDSDALAHDLRIRPPVAYTSKGYPRWDGSDAQRLLKQDVNTGLTNSIKPRVLRETRMEYQAFPLKVFREHIHQEHRSRIEKGYWLNRQQKGKK
jgi:hypothetical protein